MSSISHIIIVPAQLAYICVTFEQIDIDFPLDLAVCALEYCTSNLASRCAFPKFAFFVFLWGVRWAAKGGRFFVCLSVSEVKGANANYNANCRFKHNQATCVDATEPAKGTTSLCRSL